MAESETPGSRSIRADVVTRVKRGESDQSILDSYAARYGKSVLLEPEAAGLNLLLWAVPVGIAVGGSIGVVRVFRRKAKSGAGDAGSNEDAALSHGPRGRWIAAATGVVVIAIGAGIGIARRDEAKPATATVTREERDRRFRAQIEAHPTSGRVHLAYARFLLNENEPRALLQYVEAAKYDPSSAEATAYAGWLLYRVDGRIDAARASFEKARSLDEQYPDTYFFMGLLETQQGSAEDGRAALQRFLSMTPDHQYASQAREVLASSVDAERSQTSTPE